MLNYYTRKVESCLECLLHSVLEKTGIPRAAEQMSAFSPPPPHLVRELTRESSSGVFSKVIGYEVAAPNHYSNTTLCKSVDDYLTYTGL